MVGSSLRNSVHRRNHKERGQLVNRRRLGLLEKKKDYVKRARDYHSKQDRIRRLQEKAATRNKDEFYFSMTKNKTEGGVHVQERGNVAIPTDTVKLLKSQDENYIRTMRAAGLKKIESIKTELATLVDLFRPGQIDSESIEEDDEEELDDKELKTLRSANILPQPTQKERDFTLPSKLSGTHIVFAQDEAEAKSLKSSSRRKVQPAVAQAPQEEPVDLGWKTETSAVKKGKRKASGPVDQEAEMERLVQEQVASAKAHRTSLLKELSARLERDQSLRYALLEIQNQRLRMTNGSKQLVGAKKKSKGAGDDEDGDNPGGFTFNMNDSDEEDEERGPNGEKKWKPKVYKWKFQRRN